MPEIEQLFVGSRIMSVSRVPLTGQSGILSYEANVC